jgi:hypothetical protein
MHAIILDAKRVTRSCKSKKKNRHYNGLKKTLHRQQTKDRPTRSPVNTILIKVI